VRRLHIPFIFPSSIHSFIIPLLFSSRTTSSNFEVSPLALPLLSFSFQKSFFFVKNYKNKKSPSAKCQRAGNCQAPQTGRL